MRNIHSLVFHCTVSPVKGMVEKLHIDLRPDMDGGNPITNGVKRVNSTSNVGSSLWGTAAVRNKL